MELDLPHEQFYDDFWQDAHILQVVKVWESTRLTAIAGDRAHWMGVWCGNEWK
jgi:hypothetical protein